MHSHIGRERQIKRNIKKQLIFSPTSFIVFNVENLKEFIKYFIIFFLLSILLLLTYNMSFYSSDFIYVLRNRVKLVYIMIYSAGLSFYFSYYIIHHVKKGRILVFISGLLAILFLREFKAEIGGREPVSVESVFTMVKSVLAIISIILIYTASFLLIRKKRKKKDPAADDEYFI